MATTTINKDTNTKTGSKKRRLQIQKKLIAGLADLENQYSELIASVEKNKVDRIQIDKNGKIIEHKLNRLSKHLNVFTPYAKRQVVFLSKLKIFQKNNEALVLLIAEQLEEIENQGPLAEGDAKSLRKDLLHMLGELRDMKQKRENLTLQLSKD